MNIKCIIVDMVKCYVRRHLFDVHGSSLRYQHSVCLFVCFINSKKEREKKEKNERLVWELARFHLVFVCFFLHPVT